MSMNAMPPPRPRSENEKNCPYQASAASISPTSSAMWLIPTSFAVTSYRSCMRGSPLREPSPRREENAVPDVVPPCDPADCVRAIEAPVDLQPAVAAQRSGRLRGVFQAVGPDESIHAGTLPDRNGSSQ